MFTCDVCGRPLKKKNRIHGMTVCSKHMHQILKYGKPIDTIQRTNNDLNDYIIDYKANTVTFFTYNQKNIRNGSFIVDFDDIEKVKYHKWRLATVLPNGTTHIVTGSGKGNIKDISHVLLDVPQSMVVDHIDGDPHNNRKSNLRICSQAQNTQNKSSVSNNTSGIIGVVWDNNRKSWTAEIRINNKRIHLKRWKTFEEAVYARFVAEQILFKDYANQQQTILKQDVTKNLDTITKSNIKDYVTSKLSKHHLL